MKEEATTSNSMFVDKINELVSKIAEANKAYRTGTAIMSDPEYDTLVEELETLDPDNELLNQVGYIAPDY